MLLELDHHEPAPPTLVASLHVIGCNFERILVAIRYGKYQPHSGRCSG